MERQVNIVFFQFFMRLKTEVGIKLDLNQYQDFFNLFLFDQRNQGNTFILEEEKLLHLCKTLWLTKPQYKTKFEKCFADAIKDLEKYLHTKRDNKTSKIEKPIPDFEKKELENTTINDENDTQNLGNEDDNLNDLDDSSIGNHQNVFLSFSEDNQKGTAKATEESIKETALNVPFIFSDFKHLPVSNRKAQQAWRRLKNSYTLSKTEEIDVKRTVELIAKDKVTVDYIFQKEKNEKGQFILLRDHLGDMDLFEEWTQQLEETLKKSNKQNEVRSLYFYQFPEFIEHQDVSDFKVFKNEEHTKSIYFSQLTKKYTPDVSIIIFSDAGALEHQVDEDRITQTWRFVETLKGHFSKIVWINPLPRKKWKKTSAIHTSFFTDMVEYNLAGIQDAVKIIGM